LNWDALVDKIEGAIVVLWNASWTFKAFLLFIVGSWAWQWLAKLRDKNLKERAENWPSVTGRVTAREIKEERDDGSINAFIAVIDYSYFQDGYQSGRYKKRFDSSDEAGDWLDLLYEKEILVRVNPARRSRSTLIERELPLPIKSITTPDLYSASSTQNEDDDRWNKVLAVASLVGLTACGIFHFAALLGHGVGKEFEFTVLIVMQLYTIGLSVVVYSHTKIEGERFTAKKWKTEMDAVTPEVLRYLGKLIKIYGMGWFGWTWIQGFLGKDKNIGVPLIMFTAFQAIFLFEAYRLTQLNRWKRDAGRN
jgi:Protein of unknown function (DUF3592)